MRPFPVILIIFITVISLVIGDGEEDADEVTGMLLFYLSLKLYNNIVVIIIIQLNIIKS